MAQLNVDFVLTDDGAGDRLTQKLAEVAAQAMHAHPQRVWRYAQLGGDFHLRHRGLVAPDEDFERVKVFLPAGGGRFIPQARERLLQHRERPLPFKGLVGRRTGIGGFGRKVSFGFTLFVQREE